MGIFEEMTPWLIAERDESLSFSIANEHPPGTSVFAGGLFSSHLRRKASFRRVCGDPERKFQDLRAMSMTKKRESEGGNPPSGRKNPELLCLVLSTPREKRCKEFRRDKMRIRRISHGNARATENLRRVRMSLVPCPGSRHCLLPGMRSKTERFSITGEPEKARAPGPEAAYASLESS